MIPFLIMRYHKNAFAMHKSFYSVRLYLKKKKPVREQSVPCLIINLVKAIQHDKKKMYEHLLIFCVLPFDA